MYPSFPYEKSDPGRLQKILLIAQSVTRRKGQEMRISIYYEDKCHPITIDVPESECIIMIETDYQQRLDCADGKVVERRTVQEIMDEDCNKPTFNSHQKENRRHVSMDAYDSKGDTMPDSLNLEDLVCGADYEDLHHAIETLKPRQKELIHKVFWEQMKQVDLAKEEGVSESAIAQRMTTIYKHLKKILEKK